MLAFLRCEALPGVPPEIGTATREYGAARMGGSFWWEVRQEQGGAGMRTGGAGYGGALGGSQSEEDGGSLVCLEEPGWRWCPHVFRPYS